MRPGYVLEIPVRAQSVRVQHQQRAARPGESEFLHFAHRVPDGSVVGNQVPVGARSFNQQEFIYWNDDGQLVAIRYEGGKRSSSSRTAKAWACGGANSPIFGCQSSSTCVRTPLREATNRSCTTNGWPIARSSRPQMQEFAAKWLASFQEFPPRQKPASFNLDDVMRKFEALGAGSEARLLLVPLRCRKHLRAQRSSNAAGSRRPAPVSKSRWIRSGSGMPVEHSGGSCSRPRSTSAQVTYPPAYRSLFLLPQQCPACPREG